MKHIVTAATNRAKEIAAPLPESSYTWYKYTAERGKNLVTKSGKHKIKLSDGVQFGVRESSRGNEIRLITKELGPSIVFSITEQLMDKLIASGRKVRIKTSTEKPTRSKTPVEKPAPKTSVKPSSGTVAQRLKKLSLSPENIDKIFAIVTSGKYDYKKNAQYTARFFSVYTDRDKNYKAMVDISSYTHKLVKLCDQLNWPISESRQYDWAWSILLLGGVEAVESLLSSKSVTEAEAWLKKTMKMPSFFMTDAARTELKYS